MAKLKQVQTNTLTVRVLRAISNSGYDGAFSAVRPYLAGPDGDVRSAAVESIRLMSLADTDKIIADMMTKDKKTKVRLASINAAKVRSAGPTLMAALSKTAEAAKDSMSRQRSLRVLIAWLPNNPSLKSVIENIAKSDENPGIRKTAEAVLASDGEGV